MKNRTPLWQRLAAVVWTACACIVSASAQTDASTPPDTARSVQLKTAMVKTTRLVFVTKKDTVIYDMDALGANKNDMLGDVIAKMPGLELRDGVLFFKGRPVNRLQVNGTDFVRGDTRKGLENLPAYIIKNVKAYESLTDQAKITGIDDGEREQVVDVILKKEYMNVWTGNADLGYGTGDYWRARGFANTFTDRMRVSLYGGLANTGEYQSVGANGDWSDNGAGSSAGETVYKKPGTSFMWRNRDKQEGAGFFKVEGGLWYDYKKHNDRMGSEQETILDDGHRYMVLERSVRSTDRSVGGNLYFTWKPTDHTHVEFGPHYSYRDYRIRNRSSEGWWNSLDAAAFPSPLDSLEATDPEGWPAGMADYLQRGETLRADYKHDYGHWFWATHRLTENNWRLSVRNQFSWNDQHARQNSLNAYEYFRTLSGAPDVQNRYVIGAGRDLSSMTFVDLNIPLKIFETLRFTYGHTRNHYTSDNDGFRLDSLGGLYADPEAYLAVFGTLPAQSGWQEATREGETTVDNTLTTTKHWAEAYLQYRKGGFYASLQNCWRFTHDVIDYVKAGYEPEHLTRQATEYVFHTQLRYDTDSLGKYELRYFYSIDPHSLYSALSVPDKSDPLNIKMGNTDLKNRRMHEVSFKYDRTLRAKRFVSADARWRYYKHYLVQRTSYDPSSGVSVRQPSTVSGQWNAHAALTFSTPLDAEQHLNFSVSGRYDYTRSPYYSVATSGVPLQQTGNVNQLRGNVKLNARYGKFFATFSALVGYTRIDGTQEAASGLETWNNQIRLAAQYELPWDIDVRSQFTLRHFTGSGAEGFDPTRCIWNATVSKSLLRDKNLTLQLELSDLLNQRDQSWAHAFVGGRSSGWTDCVGRFAMLHVIYSFNTKRR